MKTLFAVIFAFLIMVPSYTFANKISPKHVDGATTINAEQAKKMFDESVVFIDVRSHSDWEAGRIPGAYHIELKSMFSEKSLNDLVAKNEKIIIYCNSHSCLRSAKASKQAVDWGFTNVYYFRDGFPVWEAADYPFE